MAAAAAAVSPQPPESAAASARDRRGVLVVAAGDEVEVIAGCGGAPEVDPAGAWAVGARHFCGCGGCCGCSASANSGGSFSSTQPPRAHDCRANVTRVLGRRA
jgi:hypothetical protein